MNIRLFAALLIALFSLSLMTGCAPGNLEAQPTQSEQLSQPPVGALTTQEAENIATAHAQVESEKITRIHTELDRDDGVYKYEIEFVTGDAEYEYKVDAKTGDILHSKVETKPAAQQPAAPERLTAEQAQEIALQHAGLTKEQVTGLKTEFGYDDGRPEYDVDFYYNGTEYDYEIHAETGEVLRSEKDVEPASASYPPATQQPAAAERLTADQAKEIALKHAGLTKDQVTRLKAEFDYDDGVPEYGVEFRYNNWEYDYEIHAQTGKILSWDKEIDD